MIKLDNNHNDQSQGAFIWSKGLGLDFGLCL